MKMLIRFHPRIFALTHSAKRSPSPPFDTNRIEPRLRRLSDAEEPTAVVRSWQTRNAFPRSAESSDEAPEPRGLRRRIKPVTRLRGTTLQVHN